MARREGWSAPTLQDRKRILELRRDGVSIERIAKITHRADRTIRQILSDAGLYPCKKNKEDNTSMIIAMEAMRERDVPWEEIAKHFGFTSRQSAALIFANATGHRSKKRKIGFEKPLRMNTSAWERRTNGRRFEDDPIAVMLCETNA